MITFSRSRTTGFITIEIMFALIVLSIIATMAITLSGNYAESQNYRIAAQQQQSVADAASKYLKDNFTAVSVAAMAAPVQITVTMLRNTGYLATGFSDTNAFGQTFLVLSRKSGTNQLESVVITTGGEVIDEIGTREIAENIGGAGGFIPVSNTSIAKGVRDGWQVTLSNFGVNPGAGHTASALFLQDGTLANDYLYRNSIAGKPELNRMNTAIDMGANDITNGQNITAAAQVEGGTLKSDGRTEVGEYVDLQSVEVEGTACAKTGLLTKNAAGLILSCQSGVWRKAESGGVITYSDWPIIYDGHCARGVELTTNTTPTICYYGNTQTMSYLSSNSSVQLDCSPLSVGPGGGHYSGICSSPSGGIWAWPTSTGVLVRGDSTVLIPWIN